MTTLSKHILISGLVQGVWFRGSMRREAERLGIKGWVRNLPDGRVEAVVAGNERAVEEILRWCMHGPSGARVEAVEQRETSARSFETFTVR